MDGEITIGTTLSTDKFDRQILDLEKKMKREEDKKIIIEAKLGSQQGDLEKARQKTDELADAYQRLKEVQDRLATGNASPKEFNTFYDLQNQFGSLEQVGANFDKALSKQEALEQRVNMTKLRYEAINDKVAEYKQKIESINLQRQTSDVHKLSSDVSKLSSGFDKVGHSIQNSIGKVARLALGVFGVRSAYLALRRASNDLASYDKQYAANLEYIRYALTQMIAPVLYWIVNLAAKLLGYINAILNGWFGINLFSRGSAKNFAKMKAGAGGVAKAVKEIKKQLAGFDEINMLTDQSSSGAGSGSGAGGVMPDFDLSKLQGEPPAWLKWIIDNRDLILAILAGITAALIAWQLGLSAIKALGIGILVAGIVYAIQALLAYLKEPTWENFGKIIQGIGVAIIGLGVLIGSLPVIIAGAIVLIVGTIIKYWEQIKSFLQRGIDWLTNKSAWVHQMLGNTIGNIYDTFVKQLQLILNWFNMTFTNIKKALDGLIQFIKGVFTGNWRQAWEGIKNIFGAIFDWIKNTVKTIIQISWNNVKNFASTVANVVAGIFKAIVNAVLKTIENILNSPIRSINRLISVINAVPRS